MVWCYLRALALALLLAGIGGTAWAQSSLELQRARAAGIGPRATTAHYPPSFNLDALPEYQPGPRLSGVIRQWGSNYIADSGLQARWEEAFAKYQPDIRFENRLHSTFIGMAGLYTDQADLAAMGRRPSWEELQAYQRMFGNLPLEISTATGSYNVPGWTFALVVFVHEDNPVGQLTLEQLDGIFGARREGGWDLNSWDPGAARGADRDIRTWGQLGLTGEWADQPINVHAYTLNYHFPRDFAEKVFKGGYRWNDALIEYSNKPRTVDSATGTAGTLLSAGEQLINALAADRYGITYTGIVYQRAGVKPLALASSAAGPYVAPTLHSVREQSYPLTRQVYHYVPRRPGQQANPLVREFLRFVLSREGQQAVQADGKYLPLTAEFIAEQLRELEAPAATRQ